MISTRKSQIRWRARSPGLFDFDWSKVDWHAFDVALAVWYFCASWEAADDGQLRLDKARTFLTAYQRRLQEGSDCPPLSPAEIRYLPHLINAGNIYVLYWTLRDYFGKPVDPEEYLDLPEARCVLRSLVRCPGQPPEAGGDGGQPSSSLAG